MLLDKAKASIEDALSWLDEVSELSEALRMGLEQIEQNPDRLVSRLTFILTNCESTLTSVNSELKANLSIALDSIERLELPDPLTQPETKAKFRISETVSEMPLRRSV